MQNQKTPRSDIGKNLDDLKFDDDILDTTSKAWSMKDTVDNLYLKTEKLWSGKDFQENEKRRYYDTDWEKIFAKNIYDKGLLSKI